jgi:hypothetical protein
MTGDPLVALETLLSAAPRGTTRDGLFAVWLTTRVTLDLQLDPPLAERALRRRLDLLEGRVTKLRIAAPLRRALVGIHGQLRAPETRSVAMALSQLVAPVKESLGDKAADALARAARGARRHRDLTGRASE